MSTGSDISARIGWRRMRIGTFGRALSRRLHCWPNPQIFFWSKHHPLQLLGSLFIFFWGGTNGIAAWFHPWRLPWRLQDEEKKQLSLEKDLQKLKKASLSGGPGSRG